MTKKTETVVIQVIHDLMRLVDSSNWPACLGDWQGGYSDAMEQVQEIISEYQQKAYDERDSKLNNPQVPE